MKRSIIIQGMLIIYLCVMSYIGWLHYSENDNLIEYFGIIILTLIVIVCLFFFLRRRDKYRIENRKRCGHKTIGAPS